MECLEHRELRLAQSERRDLLTDASTDCLRRPKQFDVAIECACLRGGAFITSRHRGRYFQFELYSTAHRRSANYRFECRLEGGKVQFQCAERGRRLIQFLSPTDLFELIRRAGSLRCTEIGDRAF